LLLISMLGSEGLRDNAVRGRGLRPGGLLRRERASSEPWFYVPIAREFSETPARCCAAGTSTA
jgi:hypothetical protein